MGFLLAIILIVATENNESETPSKPKTKSTKGSQNTKVESTPIASDIPLMKRKKIYYELAEMQDKISFDEPDYGNLQAKAYDDIAKNYKITREKVVQIVVEGTDKKWPIPPPPK